MRSRGFVDQAIRNPGSAGPGDHAPYGIVDRSSVQAARGSQSARRARDLQWSGRVTGNIDISFFLDTPSDLAVSEPEQRMDRRKKEKKKKKKHGPKSTRPSLATPSLLDLIRTLASHHLLHSAALPPSSSILPASASPSALPVS